MMKRLTAFLLTLCLVLTLFACNSREVQIEISAEQDIMERSFAIRHTTEHATFLELLEHCASESIKKVMMSFPIEDYDKLFYFTTYYIYDNDFNFPTSVIGFIHNDVTFYYTGAEQHNPFAEHAGGPVFGGNGTATVTLHKPDGAIASSSLKYYSYPDEFALSPAEPVDAELFSEVLLKITGAEFKCVNNDEVSITDNTIYISYFSYHMDKAKYTLSNSEILNEVSCSFSPSDEEFVNYSSDPEAPGGAMAQSPASLYLTFEAVKSGQTVIDIFGEDNTIIYSVEIAVDSELNAFLPNEAF